MATSNSVDLKIQAIVDGLENVAQLTSELGELEEAGSQQVPDNTQDLREGADDTSGVMEGLRDNIGKVVAAGAALGGVAAALRSSVNTFTDYDTRLRTINSVLETTGRSAEITGDEIREMSQDLARATLGSVEGFEEAATQVLAFKNVGTDSLGSVLELAQDMSQTFGGDVANNARRLAMALDAPSESLSRLRRSGIQFTEDQEEVIESLVETGDMAAAQAKILEAVAGRVGGAARDAAEGLAGQFDTLSQQFEEFRRASGEAIEPALTAFLGEVSGALEWLAENTDTVIRGAQSLGLALTAVAGKKLLGSLATTATQIAAIGRAAISSGSAVRALGIAMNALPGAAILTVLSGIAFGLLSWRDAARQAREEQAELHSETIRTATDFQILQAQLDDTIISQEKAGTAQEQLNQALEDGTVVVDEITGNYRRAGETLADLIEQQQRAAQAQADLTRDEMAGDVRDQAAAIVEQGQALAGLSEQFDTAAEKAKESTKSVEGLVGQLDLADDANIQRVRQELDRISRDSTIAAGALRDQLIPQLESFPGLGPGGQQLLDDLRAARAETLSLSDALDDLGIDPEVYRSGLTTVEQETIATFERLARDPNVTGEVIADAFRASLERIGKEAVPDLQRALTEAFDQGRITQEQYNAAIEATEKKIRGAEDAAKDLGKAYKDLSVAELAREQAALGEALREGRIEADEYAQSVDAITAAYRQQRQDAAAAREAQREASEEAVAGAEAAADATEQAGDTTNVYVGNIQSWTDALSGFFDNVQQDLAGLSDAALRRFQELRGATAPAEDGIEAVRANIANLKEEIRTIRFDNITAGGLGKWVGDVAIAARKAKIEFAEQAFAVQQLEESMRTMADGGEISLRALDEARRRVSQGFTALDDEQLSGLRGAIESVERRLQSLRDSASSTLDSLQDELLRLQGREEELERRRLERRKEEIRAQLELAEGDAKATRQLEESLDVLEQIGNERRQQRKEEEQARTERESATPEPADDAGGGAAQTDEPTRTVRMDINIGGTRGQFDVPAGQEDQVERLFRQLESQQAVST